MVQMFGESGALKDLLLILKQNEIYFDSLESILTFKDNWNNDIENYREKKKIGLLEEIQQQKVSLEEYLINYEIKIKDRTQLLLKEKEEIKIKLEKYSAKTNPIKAIYNFLRYKQSIRRQNKLEHSFDKELHRPFKKLDKKIQNTKNDIYYKENNIEKVVEQRSEDYISNIQRTKSILDSQYPLISGAIGEERAIEKLLELPDSFYVINDFKLEFDTPIYNRSEENDRIYSIQIDHLVIGPSGIFIIETKNWSKKSVENLDLFSPVKQIKRSSYALFIYLNKTKDIRLSKHHWGKKKISTRNILLMINAIPKEEFQFVKILSLNRLKNYLTYFDKIFSDKDVKAIFNYLINT